MQDPEDDREPKPAPRDISTTRMMGDPRDFAHLMPAPPSEDDVADALAEFTRRQAERGVL